MSLYLRAFQIFQKGPVQTHSFQDKPSWDDLNEGTLTGLGRCPRFGAFLEYDLSSETIHLSCWFKLRCFHMKAYEMAYDDTEMRSCQVPLSVSFCFDNPLFRLYNFSEEPKL